MAQMVGLGGTVTGIDYPELAEMARRNISKSWAPMLEGLTPRITVLSGDGWEGGPGAPFNAIHVGAAAATVPPRLLADLAAGGRMIIPIGPVDGTQVMHVIDKALDGTFQDQATIAVRFVPLVPRVTSAKPTTGTTAQTASAVSF